MFLCGRAVLPSKAVLVLNLFSFFFFLTRKSSSCTKCHLVMGGKQEHHTRVKGHSSLRVVTPRYLHGFTWIFKVLERVKHTAAEQRRRRFWEQKHFLFISRTYSTSSSSVHFLEVSPITQDDLQIRPSFRVKVNEGILSGGVWGPPRASLSAPALHMTSPCCSCRGGNYREACVEIHNPVVHVEFRDALSQEDSVETWCGCFKKKKRKREFPWCPSNPHAPPPTHTHTQSYTIIPDKDIFSCKSFL